MSLRNTIKKEIILHKVYENYIKTSSKRSKQPSIITNRIDKITELWLDYPSHDELQWTGHIENPFWKTYDYLFIPHL